MKWLVFLFPAVCLASLAEEVRRIHFHLSLDDANTACLEAEKLVEAHPESLEVHRAWIEALAAAGLTEKAVDEWNVLSEHHPDLMEDRHLLEELCWGILKKGSQSTQYGTRLSSLVGVYLTQDARAVPILLKMMRDSNATVRSVAIQMATHFSDAPLKEEIRRLFFEEKTWMVRLAVIQAAGALRMKELAPQLTEIVQSQQSTYEERGLAIEALLHIYEKLSLHELQLLFQSERAGMRQLACSIATHFEIEEAAEWVAASMKDANPHVRITALNGLGLFYRKKIEKEKVKELLNKALADSHPTVAITAAWVALLLDASWGENYFQKWLSDSFAENRRLAAAALAAAGAYGADLASKFLTESQDPYVQANLAIGLLGQRREIGACCNLLFGFLENEKRICMWDGESNPLFPILAPSKVRHVDHIPNYPEAVDQITRLQLVSLLALVDDARAVPALKTFLQKHDWSLTGAAAALLLQEGDDSSLDVVRTLLQDPDPEVHFAACLVLAMIGRDESVLTELQGAYGSADHERKLHILEALARIGSPNSHSFFVGLLREPFPVLRVAAAAALIQSLNR